MDSSVQFQDIDIKPNQVKPIVTFIQRLQPQILATANYSKLKPPNFMYTKTFYGTYNRQNNFQFLIDYFVCLLTNFIVTSNNFCMFHEYSPWEVTMSTTCPECRLYLDTIKSREMFYYYEYTFCIA